MASGQYEFGAYRLDAQSRMLFKDGDHVPLPFGGGTSTAHDLQAAVDAPEPWCRALGRLDH